MSNSDAEKRRFSVTLTEENVEWLDGVCNNRSGYIDDLIELAREGDAIREQMLELDVIEARSQLKEAEAELEAKQARVEANRERLETLQDKQASEEQREQDYLDELDDWLDQLEEAGRVWPENKQVQIVAERWNRTAQEVFDTLKQRAIEQERGITNYQMMRGDVAKQTVVEEQPIWEAEQ